MKIEQQQLLQKSRKSLEAAQLLVDNILHPKKPQKLLIKLKICLILLRIILTECKHKHFFQLTRKSFNAINQLS